MTTDVRPASLGGYEELRSRVLAYQMEQLLALHAKRTAMGERANCDGCGQYTLPRLAPSIDNLCERCLDLEVAS